MVSIPRSTQDVLMQGGQGSLHCSGATTPTTPGGNWEETLQNLSRELEVICRSPTREFGSPRTSSRASPIFLNHDTTSPSLHSAGLLSPGRGSPSCSSPTHTDNKPLEVRHQMSEETLQEKLYSICHSPRTDNIALSSLSRKQALPPPSPNKSKPVRPPRKKSFIIPYFRATVDVGDRGVEDLSVKVENHILRVFFRSPEDSPPLSSTSGESHDNTKKGDLPAEVVLPADVDPTRLICIVKDGILEVRETRRSSNNTQQQRLLHGRVLTGLDLRRTLSGGNATDQSPIIIEDEGSHQFKLVLQIPDGYTFQDLKIKTVDDHLIVSGRRPSPNTTTLHGDGPAMLSALDEKLRSLGERKELFHVFQMPASADPYSVTAHLTEKQQLVIQAVLSARCRSNTL